MKLGNMLTKVGSVVCTSLLGTALSVLPAFAQSSRPYVVFVNGWQNCCSWGMNALQKRLINDMNAEPRYVPYSNFNEDGKSGNTSTDDPFLRDGADYINNQLDRNRPLILIGHSFGGDSVLKLLPRINRRVQFVAVIDPVRTGGFRATLTGLNVPSNVDYFFNRWQKNEPFPNDFPVDGSIQCNARKCDQDSQFALTDINGNPRKEKCKLLEACRTKQVRAGHQSLPTDDWIQRIIGDRIQERLAAFRPPSPAVNPLATGEFYIKRIGEHCEWLLTNTGLTPEWRLIQSSAQKDAGNTSSEYYRNRLAAHCQYFLSHTDRTDKWNVIEDSARKDAKIPLVSK